MYDADQNGVMSFEEFVSLHGFLNLVCVHPLFFLIMQMLNCCTCNWIELSVFFFRQRHASFSVWKILLFIIVISCGELSCWVPQVQTSFSNVSRDRGFLALNEVYQALQQAGFTLDEPSFYTACQSFDPNRLGKFKLDDYISMCIFLQSAKNLFGAFDTSRIGHITLDFNQFVYCAANLRV
jgi:hypothetical protein